MAKSLTFVVMMICAAYGAVMTLTALANGTSAIHEIEALIGTLIVTVALGAWHVGVTIDGLKPKQPGAGPTAPPQ